MATTHVSPAPAVYRPDGESRPAATAPARERWSWALYDFANTMFSMNVATLFFTVWFVSDLGGTNTQISVANSLSSLLVALSIPVLGAISDARQRRKPWVVGFTLACVALTALMGVVGHTLLPHVGDNLVGGGAAGSAAAPAGAMLLLLALFVVANYAYQGALPFYNAMLPELVPPSQQGRLSGLGTALGYIGSIVGVLVGMLYFAGGIPGVLALPARAVAGLRGVFPFSGDGGRVSTFMPTAALFLVASVPFFLFCRDRRSTAEARPVRLGAAFREVGATVRDAKKYPGALRFILASLLYQDAMGTIISVMALYAVEAVGFRKGAETTMFVMLTVPAVFGSYLLGIVSDRKGPKWTLQFVLLSWVVLLVAMILAPTKAAFLAVGVGIGMVFGGIGTAERPMLLSLVPAEEAGRFFGLMVLSARAAAIVGPLVWALAVDGLMPVFGKAIAYRAGIASLTLAMVGAWWLLRGVPDRARAADPVVAA